MRRLFYGICGLGILAGCANGGPAEDAWETRPATSDQQQVTVDTHAAMAPETASDLPLPTPAVMQSPQGIYELRPDGKTNTAHIIQFLPGRNFRMQYGTTADSIQLVEGTWAASNGFIWVYRNNVAWGRYRWKGNVLQYFSPQSGKSYDMLKRTGILENTAWQSKPAEGLRFFGIGNEPFWSVGLTNTDSLQFLLADKGRPVNVAVHERLQKGDSLIYEGRHDSASIRLVVVHRFCEDGMSDNLYPQTVLVRYNGQVYKGCGVKYR